jgi:hypothetical protein
MAIASAPVKRGQGNAAFRSEPQDRQFKRGQTSPHDVNGRPSVPPDEPGMMSVYIADIASGDPAEPLLEFEVLGSDVVFTGVYSVTAGVAATAPTVLPIEKNGAANGNITITGSTGVLSLSDSTYAVGDLFSLYPPATADATLDRVRISLEVA